MRRCLVLVSVVALCGLCRDAAASHLETFLTGLASPLFSPTPAMEPAPLRRRAGRRRSRWSRRARPRRRSSSTSPIACCLVASTGCWAWPSIRSSRRTAGSSSTTRARPDGATVIAEYSPSADPNVATARRRSSCSRRPALRQPQRRDDRVRPRRLPLHRPRRRRLGQRPRQPRAERRRAARQDPADRRRSAGGGLHDPPDNPFAGATPGRDEIYAIGLRNPFRFSFDRQTGELWSATSARRAGGDRHRHARARTSAGAPSRARTAPTSSPPAPPTGFTRPIAEYDHTGGRCSVTGGYVYRGDARHAPDRHVCVRRLLHGRDLHAAGTAR